VGTKGVTKQETLQLKYENYRVVAIDNENKSCFVVRLRNEENVIDDYCWCSTNQPVALGDLIEGYLRFSPGSGKSPMLIIR
jgi:hypothetical protein